MRKRRIRRSRKRLKRRRSRMRKRRKKFDLENAGNMNIKNRRNII